jgi:hypothetical protein
LIASGAAARACMLASSSAITNKPFFAFISTVLLEFAIAGDIYVRLNPLYASSLTARSAIANEPSSSLQKGKACS